MISESRLTTSESLFTSIVEDLISSQAYSVQTQFLSSEEVSELQKDFEEHFSAGSFSPAAIGQHQERLRNAHIRSDLTHWWNVSDPTPSQRRLLDKLEALRLACNQHLYLGLLDFEGHYAFYGPKSFYRKHRDSFRHDDARRLSVVLYLNENWKEGDGGELLLHAEIPRKIEPRAGTLVVFLSESVYHEVLESNQNRKSFSGWFKRRR